MTLKKSDGIVFFGDSITEMGNLPGGYVRIFTGRLNAELGMDAPEAINSGRSGDKVTDLLARLDKDVLSESPSVVIVYISINDVRHFSLPGHIGTPQDMFEREMTNLIGWISSSCVRSILCTPSVIGELNNPGNPSDAVLDGYSEICRGIAAKIVITLRDLQQVFVSYLAKHNRENRPMASSELMEYT